MNTFLLQKSIELDDYTVNTCRPIQNGLHPAIESQIEVCEIIQPLTSQNIFPQSIVIHNFSIFNFFT